MPAELKPDEILAMVNRISKMMDGIRTSDVFGVAIAFACVAADDLHMSAELAAAKFYAVLKAGRSIQN